jgi:transposase InsO family protein
VLEHIRSDNGAKFTANSVRNWLEDLGVTTFYIEPGSPRENGCVESYIEELRDYNEFRPYSSLGDLTPRQFVDKYKSSLRSQKTPLLAGSIFA